MPKCLITGHTSGLGKFLYEQFNSLNWEVIGVSSGNGYKLPEKMDEVIQLIEGCDLFINNSFASGCQVQLLELSKFKVPKIVVCGSISRLFPLNNLISEDYVKIKTELYEKCNLLSSIEKDKIAQILHLDLQFLEPEGDLSYLEIFNIIDFWLKYPIFRNIEFSWKFNNNFQKQLIKNTKNFKQISVYKEILDNVSK